MKRDVTLLSSPLATRRSCPTPIVEYLVRHRYCRDTRRASGSQKVLELNGYVEGWVWFGYLVKSLVPGGQRISVRLSVGVSVWV